MTCISKKCAAELPEGAAFCHVCGKRQGMEPRKHLKRGNNTGTVYRLTGRRRRPWAASKAKVIIGYYEKKNDAIDALNEFAKRPISERYNMTFKEVYEAWKIEHFRDIGPKGEEGYETAYMHLEALHERKFRDIRTEHYQREIDKLIEKGRSHSTTNKLKQLIGQMSKWAMREEITTTNFAPFLKQPENRTSEKEIFSDSDIKKLKESKDDAAKIILMLIYTGMRIGELFLLPVADVHEKYCIGGEKTDTGKNRVIPIPSEVRKHFEYFRIKSLPNDLLLSGYVGNQEIRKFREKDFYPLLESLDIKKKTPHCTRHTYASMAVKAGMRPEVLQKILGHAEYDTTADNYVHFDVDALIAAAETVVAKKNVKK